MRIWLFWDFIVFCFFQVVDFRKKSIMYFDSMGGNNDKACEILL